MKYLYAIEFVSLIYSLEFHQCIFRIDSLFSVTDFKNSFRFLVKRDFAVALIFFASSAISLSTSDFECFVL